MRPRKRIRVLVVDDQPVVRALLDRGLSEDPGIEVVGRATDAFAARDQIIKLQPDVITLDVEMPRMTGLEFLRRLMPQYPLPVIMVSSLTGSGQRATLEALEAGAVDFVCKPEGGPGALHGMLEELREKVKMASRIDKRKLRGAEPVATPKPLEAVPKPSRTQPAFQSRSGFPKIIALGASTGGTLAIRDLLSTLTTDLPGIVMVQHMPAGFTAMFAGNLNKLTGFDVKEAADGDGVIPGTVLIAPGDFHVIIRKYAGNYSVELRSHEKVQGHRPSVDVLFESVAEQAGNEAIGILLTGMGSDGARGLLRMRARGARTIGQDEESCVVYGMPRVAHELGAVEYQRSIGEIPRTLVQLVGQTIHQVAQ